VAETAQFLVDLVTCDRTLGATLNVCRGEEVSIHELARLVIELTRSRSAIEYDAARPSDVLRLCGDTTRLRAVLGKSPSISIREGLTRTIEWFRDNVTLTQALIDSLQVANWTQQDAEDWLRPFVPGVEA
jgi:dTDP-D-glucose 4,6-dehydratase